MKKKIWALLLCAIVAVTSVLVSQSVFAVGYNYNTDVRNYLETKSVPQTIVVGEIGKIYPKKDSILLEAQYAFRYEVSDPSILTIQDNGRYVAHQPGQVTIKIRMTANGEDPRFAEELAARKIVPEPYDAATPYPAYEAIVQVVAADFQPVYRLYNSASKVHLYTTDSNEKAVLSSTKDWDYEGVSWRTQMENRQLPVYRLYHHGLGKHLYTKDSNEHQVLQTRGWKSEGTSFYSVGDLPVYRLYLPTLKKHLYTTDENEKNVLQTRGWNYEGTAWNSIP